MAPSSKHPERPVTYDVIALGLGIEVTTVHEHLRRIRRPHPELYADLMADRQRRMERWHADVARRRPEWSRRWGKQRWHVDVETDMESGRGWLGARRQSTAERESL